MLRGGLPDSSLHALKGIFLVLSVQRRPEQGLHFFNGEGDHFASKFFLKLGRVLSPKRLQRLNQYRESQRADNLGTKIPGLPLDFHDCAEGLVKRGPRCDPIPDGIQHQDLDVFAAGPQYAGAKPDTKFIFACHRLPK